MLAFDLTQTPYSRFESYFSISEYPAGSELNAVGDGPYIRFHQGIQRGRREIVRLALLDTEGHELELTSRATPGRTRLVAGKASCEATIHPIDTVRLAGRNCSLLRDKAYTWTSSVFLLLANQLK